MGDSQRNKNRLNQASAPLDKKDKAMSIRYCSKSIPGHIIVESNLRQTARKRDAEPCPNPLSRYPADILAEHNGATAVNYIYSAERHGIPSPSTATHRNRQIPNPTFDTDRVHGYEREKELYGYAMHQSPIPFAPAKRPTDYNAYVCISTSPLLSERIFLLLKEQHP